MVQQGGGRIVHISSRGAFRGEPEMPAYGASKAGLNALSQSLAKALAAHQVFLYVVAPGWVETERAAATLAGPAGDAIGMVRDEWIAAVTHILFFGGADPFIPLARLQQIEARFKALGKEYTVKVYPDADHGFFCHERSSYNRLAAEDAWRELTAFFAQHLRPAVS